MKKQIAFRVKKVDGKMVFDCDGLLFDRLDTHQVFQNGDLIVCRNGEIIDWAYDIDQYGEPKARICFIGLRDVYATPTIFPNQYKVDDAFCLAIPCEPNFDFKKFLRDRFIMHLTVPIVLRKKCCIGLEDLQNLLLEEAARLRNNQGIANAKLLQFN